MEEQILQQILDKLVVQATTQQDYIQLSCEEQAIASLDLLIGTATRNGIVNFFVPENQYLWSGPSLGFKLTGAEECRHIYNNILNAMLAKKDPGSLLNQLQDRIVVHDFEFLYTALRQYVEKNFLKNKS